MPVFADRIHELTTTTGTGTVSLGGTAGAPGGAFRTFVAGVGSGALVAYCIASRVANEFEIGLGTVTDASTDTLSRDKVISSSNSNAAVNFTSGIKDVTLSFPAEYMAGFSRFKRPVRAAATTNVTLTTAVENGDSLGGVTLATGDRVLLTGQSTASQNGVYVVASSGTPARASDLFTGDAASGSVVVVQSGTSGGTIWVCTAAAGSDVVGTNNLTWSVTTASVGDDLNAIEALTGTGLLARTTTNTWALRTLTAPAAGLTVTNGDGVSGNPTLALANDLAALEGLSSTGLIARTGDGTASVRTVTAGTGITVSNGDGVSGNPTISRESLAWYVITYGATVTPDRANGLRQRVTLTGPVTLAAPTNLNDGETLLVILLQDGTGSRAVTASAFAWTSNTVPSFNTTANRADIIAITRYGSTYTAALANTGVVL